MKRFRPPAPTLAALFAGVALGAFGMPAESASYLPDSTVLARVDERVIRVHDFRDRYFGAEAETKPGPDSLGRVTFLNTMIDKEVMGLTAQALNRPLTANDEFVMNSHRANMLAFLTYKRNVQDLVVVTDRELKARYAEQSYELRLRYILIRDEATARTVRGELFRGRITWKDAATRYSVAPDSLREGDLGWLGRSDMRGFPLAVVFALRPPGISEVTFDEDGCRIWQCLDRRPVQLAPYHIMRRTLLNELRSEREGDSDRDLMDLLTQRSHPEYDTTNIVWLADRFRIANASLRQSTSGSIDLRSRAPVLESADTSRVLATTMDSRLTCGRLLTAYKDMSPLRRQRLQTPIAVFRMVQRMVLEPAVVRYALERGYDRDPEFEAELAKRREALLVQHLYEDSVDTNIQVTDAMRRAYYQAHQGIFMTRERVVYAIIPRMSEAGADSVLARLRSGESARSILARDSLTGMTRGSIRELLEGQPHSYYNILFTELRQGEATKEHFITDSVWVVMHVVSHEAAKPLSYAEARDLADQAAENETAERILGQFLARQRKRHRIHAHPELLPRMQLTDPSSDWNIPAGD